MRERTSKPTSTDDAYDALPSVDAGRRFPRSVFGGYRRRDVDELLADMAERIEVLERQGEELRDELQDRDHTVSETRHDLSRARAELRYWNDRASYVDSEVARARVRATELERAARERADAIEADAQERSLQLVDRVCSEANAMLQAARAEAREMFLRFETDVEMSQTKLAHLNRVRTEVASTMQGALTQFEAAVRQLDEVGPIRRIVEALEEPERPAVPTFGKQRAMEAARRFEIASEDLVSAVLTSPVTPRTTGESVAAVGGGGEGGTAAAAGVAGDHEATPRPATTGEAGSVTGASTKVADERHAASSDGSSGLLMAAGAEALAAAFDENEPLSPSRRRRHPADEEFAALLQA